MTAKESNLPKINDQTGSIKKLTDFSIDAILKSESEKIDNQVGPSEELDSRFAWLKCSRYKPPKLPRKKEIYKRRHLGRSARIPFSSHQVAALEEKFRLTQYLSSYEVTELGHLLGISEIRVKIWFQNRRARQRRERQTTIRQMVSSQMNINFYEESLPKLYHPFNGVSCNRLL
ncbi:homeobox protein MSX-1-like [Centruroides sculpturatus]|uniref:homeobox protein MSX-1-like n=1 Tax=Centruroides sculpturatus TaxID=218467 RepID=UPI000C6DF31B|nr:homeobox protein MSX-1-like [Centruroides sculpturatus]